MNQTVFFPAYILPHGAPAAKLLLYVSSANSILNFFPYSLSLWDYTKSGVRVYVREMVPVQYSTRHILEESFEMLLKGL